MPDLRALQQDLDQQTGPRFRRLNMAVAQLLDDFSMISFTPLDNTDEESVEYLLLQIDSAIQVRWGIESLPDPNGEVAGTFFICACSMGRTRRYGQPSMESLGTQATTEETLTRPAGWS